MGISIKQSSKDLYAAYVEKMQRIADIRYASAVLQWDQETYLPVKGANARARQLATLSELAHSAFTDEQLGNMLDDLLVRDDLGAKQRKNIFLTQEEYAKQKKFNALFIRQMSEAISTSFHAWMESRKHNSFAIFEPALHALVELKKKETEILGYKLHPYNALLNEYEKGVSVKMLDEVFEQITKPLQEIIEAIAQQPIVDDSFLHQHYPKGQQWDWGMYMIKQLGFDFDAGRQDISEHPFTTNFCAKDVRITTRIDEHDFANMTWSCIHETGHALYEQGLPDEDYGLPSGEYASLGIHESQSRLWENCVGRSLHFWQYYYPKLQQYFPKQLDGISVNHFYKAINKVRPSLIRTEADEVTYHFHIKIRYLIEKEIIEGSLNTKDIAARWNELYQANLGIQVTSDVKGCLQDIHWSHGSFGYFPTYSLGSFYATQLWTQAVKEMPNLQNDVATKGETKPLLDWLRKQIHQHGKLFTSEELSINATGKALDSSVFITSIREKYL